MDVEAIYIGLARRHTIMYYIPFEMGMILHLVGVALSVLLISTAYGTEAFRSSSHQASQELDHKFHAPINKTNLLLVGGLFNQTSDPTYYAIHSAMTTESGGSIYGFVGTIDAFGFSLSHAQGSGAGVWFVHPADGSRSSEQEIMVGWHVLPAVYGDSRTHFFTRWTTDGYLKTGCLNNKCSGFKPEKGATIAPGDVIDRVPLHLNLKIVKDGVSGDWLVHCGMNEEPKLIGRFPRSLFTGGGGLVDKATAVSFGGAVTAPVADPVPMGNGYLPISDAAASFSDVQLVDQSGHARTVIKDLSRVESRPKAYRVSSINYGQFFYGGPKWPPYSRSDYS